MKTIRLHTLATAAAALMLLSGMYFAAPAGQRTHRTATRDAQVTSTPAPVVDDTPINPDTDGKIRPGNGRKNTAPANKPPQRRAIRR